MFRIYIYIFIM